MIHFNPLKPANDGNAKKVLPLKVFPHEEKKKSFAWFDF